jgi:hypothetical protein
MTMPFGTLWLPVIVSAVVVWISSAVLHMVAKYHNADYKGLPNEDAVGEVMRKASLAPGVYAIPYCPDPRRMKEPAVVDRYDKGPVALISVLRNGVPAMGKLLSLWFGYCLLVSFVTAYVARHTLSYGTEGLTVMRVTGTVSLTAYGISHLSDSIWKGEPWSNSLRALLDAAIYGVLTGLTFRLLWPA